MAVIFSQVTSETDISQILDLQAHNLFHAISPETAREQGFLTVQHTYEALWKMNQGMPSIIAKNENKVIGYALIMLPEFKAYVPVLQPMFDLLDGLEVGHFTFKNRYDWFVMGQVCVAKEFRGQGVFDGMYHHMSKCCKGKYRFTVTEVAEKNTRSLRVHERAGFKTIHQYEECLTGQAWRVVTLEF